MFDFPAAPSVGTVYSPAGGPTYMWDGTTWLVLDAGAAVPAAYKITSGELTAPAQIGGQFAMPSLDNFHSCELLVKGAAPSSGGAQSASLQFSWDGGATWPAASNQYYYGYQYVLSSNTGAAAGGTTSSGFFIWSLGVASLKSSARLWLPLVDAAGMQSFQGQSHGWNGSAYDSRTFFISSALVTGPPTHARIILSNIAFAAGLKWQLNGFK